MPITDVMIDLETLGTRVESGVPVLSIGWCCWDADAPWPEHGPYQAAQLFIKGPPGKIDFGTLHWWSGQPGEALRMLLANGVRGLNLDEALQQLKQTIASLDKPRIWSHGSMFDIAILEYWYRYWEMTPPWNYWQVMDTRTIYALCREKLSSNSHDAMADAINQAALVHECWQRTKAARSGPR